MHHHRPELGVTAVGAILMRLPFQPFVQFHGGLEQQENTAEQQDQIAAGEAKVRDAKQRRGQRNHPGNYRQQTQTHKQRQRQSEDTRFITLLRRQLIGQNGDKHQVVDTQYNFQHDKCQ